MPRANEKRNYMAKIKIKPSEYNEKRDLDLTAAAWIAFSRLLWVYCIAQVGAAIKSHAYMAKETNE